MTKTAPPKTVEVGMFFHATYADGNCKWKVLRALGGGSWLCRIVEDHDYNGTEKAFLTREILHSIGLTHFFESTATEAEKFLQSQTEGTILHYHNGGGDYVRQIVVKHEGKMKLKPAALVGNWDVSDLPQRRPNGTIYYPYHAAQIMDQVLKDGLNVTTTYEHPDFVKPHPSKNIDPKTAAPIFHAKSPIPPMTSQQQTAAKLWRLVEGLQVVLQGQPKDGDPFAPATPMNRLLQAAKLLKDNDF